MTKIFSMFMITTLLALSVFAIFFAISPVNEREKTVSSQGVYMLQNTKIVKNDEQLVDELLEKLMNYCYDKGINASFIQTEQGIELVSVTDETGAYTSITNLSVPKFGVLNKDNMDSYLSEMKLAIDTALSNNNKK